MDHKGVGRRSYPLGQNPDRLIHNTDGIPDGPSYGYPEYYRFLNNFGGNPTFGGSPDSNQSRHLPSRNAEYEGYTEYPEYHEYHEYMERVSDDTGKRFNFKGPSHNTDGIPDGPDYGYPEYYRFLNNFGGSLPPSHNADGIPDGPDYGYTDYFRYMNNFGGRYDPHPGVVVDANTPGLEPGMVSVITMSNAVPNRIETNEPSLETPFGLTFSYDIFDKTPLYVPGTYYFVLEYEYRGLVADNTIQSITTELGQTPEAPKTYQFENQWSHTRVPMLSDYNTRYVTGIVEATAGHEFGAVYIDPRSWQGPRRGTIVNVLMSADSIYFYKVKSNWNGDDLVVLELCESIDPENRLNYLTGDWSNATKKLNHSGPSKVKDLAVGQRLQCRVPVLAGGTVEMRCYVEPPIPQNSMHQATVFPPGRYQIAYTYLIHTGTAQKLESNYSVWSEIAGGTSMPWKLIRVVNWDALLSQPNFPKLGNGQRIALNVYVKLFDVYSEEETVFLAAENQAIPPPGERYTVQDCQLCNAAGGCKDLKCYKNNECPSGCECIDGKCKKKPPLVPEGTISLITALPYLPSADSANKQPVKTSNKDAVSSITILPGKTILTPGIGSKTPPLKKTSNFKYILLLVAILLALVVLGMMLYYAGLSPSPFPNTDALRNPELF